MPRKVYEGPAMGTAHRTVPEQPPEWEPRPLPGNWWQTCQEREALAERLLTAFTSAGAVRGRDQTRRRGLTKLLDWLQGQPGETWQDRWLASGADAAGFDWAILPLDGEPSPRHRRDELTSGLVLLVAGQVIRPTYRWLMRQRHALMLAEARRAIDPEGFGRLEQHARDAIGWARSDALNKLTWMVICKGGLIADITVGDCIELTAALQEHHFRGSAGRPLLNSTFVGDGGVGEDGGGGDPDAGADADPATAACPGELLLLDEPPVERWLSTTDTTTRAPMPARMFRTQWLLLPRRGGCCGGP